MCFHFGDNFFNENRNSDAGSTCVFQLHSMTTSLISCSLTITLSASCTWSGFSGVIVTFYTRIIGHLGTTRRGFCDYVTSLVCGIKIHRSFETIGDSVDEKSSDATCTWNHLRNVTVVFNVRHLANDTVELPINITWRLIFRAFASELLKIKSLLELESFVRNSDVFENKISCLQQLELKPAPMRYNK